MKKNLQETQTSVQCPKCQGAFRLSGEDSVQFLIQLKVQVECPTCRNQVFISAIPVGLGTKNKVSKSGASMVGAALPKKIGNVVKGEPPFKPLGTGNGPSVVNSSPSIPFAPLANPGQKSPIREKPVEEMAKGDDKSWLQNQTPLSKGLMVLVGVLLVALSVMTFQVFKKQPAGKSLRESEGLVSVDNHPSGNGAQKPVPINPVPVQISSEDSLPGIGGRKKGK